MNSYLLHQVGSCEEFWADTLRGGVEIKTVNNSKAKTSSSDSFTLSFIKSLLELGQAFLPVKKVGQHTCLSKTLFAFKQWKAALQRARNLERIVERGRVIKSAIYDNKN